MQSLSDFDSSDSVELRLMSREYTVEGDRPIVHLFGRDASGERHWYEVTGHRPSLFIRAEEHESSVDNHYAVVDTKYRDEEADDSRSASSVDSSVDTDEEGNEFQDLDGNQLVKVEATTPERVSDLRDMFEWTGEADVFYVNRFAIDLGLKTGVKIDISDVSDGSFGGSDGRIDVSACTPLSTTETPTVEPRICHFDIEVAAENGVPDSDRAEEPVSSIVALTDGRYTGWILRSDEWDVETPAEFTDPDARSTEVGCHDVRVFSDESELLDDFHSYIEDTDPDILTGWNSNGFDIPYLINRSKKLSTYGYQRWSPLGETFVGRFEPAVKGRACVDMMGAFEKTQIHELDSKALSDVAADVTDHEKIDIDQSHIEMWRENPVEFLRYNKVDTELVHRIDEAVGATDLLGNLRDLIGCSWTDPIGGNIDMIDQLFLRRARDYGYVLPTAEKPDRDWYYGAKVFEPTPGISEHVVYLDASSMYPSFIKQMNISPETLIGTTSDPPSDAVWGYIDRRSDAMKENSDPQYEQCYYDTSKEGFVSSLVDELIALKNEYRGNEGKYEAVKRIVNSVYGVLSDADSYNRGFRLFDWKMGESICLSGRKFITECAERSIEWCHENGYENAYVALGDTDGYGVSIPDVESREEALRVGWQLENHLNEQCPEISQELFGVDPSDNAMEMECESYASRLFVKADDEGRGDSGVRKKHAQTIEWEQ
jgi:DNA polymerase I